MKKFLILFSLFFILFIPNFVNASTNGIIEFKINNIDFINSNNEYRFWGVPNANLNIQVNSTNVANLYKYYIIYFISPSSDTSFNVSISGGCTNSCFSSNAYVKLIDNVDNYNYYAIVLPIGKSNCGVGTGQCIIESTITLTHSSDYVAIIKGVDALDNDNIINNNYEAFLNIINNNNTNTQNIINNQNQNQAQTHQDMQNIDNTMKDETGVPNSDVSDKTSEWSSKLAGTGPVSNMVLMPITLLNGYISGFNSTCSPYNLGNLMGTDIILPCINISNYLGTTLWNVIDVLFSGFMIYAIGKKFVKIFNDFTNLRDNQIDELYGGGK